MNLAGDKDGFQCLVPAYITQLSKAREESNCASFNLEMLGLLDL